jgi:putative PIN family toxin of toxin-antitoxin system
MRVFLDTNIWVSAIASPGLCDELLKQLFRSHEVLGSELVWSELASVLAHKLGFSPQEIDAARAMYSEAIQLADVAKPRKDSDARLVAAAAAGGADLFATGDKRVLEWGTSGSMRIVSPRDAWIILFEPQLNR